MTTSFQQLISLKRVKAATFLVLLMGGGMYAQTNTFPVSGNAGVGTTNPGEKLEVVGNLKVKGDLIVIDTAKFKGDVKILGSLKLKSLADNTQTYSRLLGVSPGGTVLTNSNLHFNTPNGILDVNGSISANGSVRASRFTGLLSDTVIHFGDSSISVHTTRNYFYVDASANPTFKGLGLGFNCFSLGANGIGIGFSSHGSGTNTVAIGNNVVAFATNSMVIGSSASNFDRIINNKANTLMIGFDSDSATLFVSKSAGKGTTGTVCIGTTYVPNNPNIKLAVKGWIIAEELQVKLRAQWPDYVFAFGYKLMSIEERQFYTDTYHHLPWMLSASEIGKNGAPVGTILAGITRNVEEHELLIYELKKQIDELKQKVKELEKKTLKNTDN